MATIFSDDFNRGNEELGASADWTERGGAGVDFNLVSNEIEHIAAGANIFEDVGYNNSGTYGTADYEVSAEVKQPSGNPQPGVIGRRVNDGATSSDYYGIILKQSGNEVNLTKRLSESQTEIVNDTTVTINADTFYTLRMRMSGTTISGFLDEVEIVGSPHTDSDIAAAGDAGLMMSNSDGAIWDDFLAATLVAAAGNPWYAYAQQ